MTTQCNMKHKDNNIGMPRQRYSTGYRYCRHCVLWTKTTFNRCYCCKGRL